MRHNLNEEYLQSLTEEQREEEMSQWTATEVQEYLCPNGTVSIDYFFEQLEKKVVEMAIEKYGRSNI